MIADVVDYSRLMSCSEDETHARLAGHAHELIEPTIARYGGRLVRRMGDGLLVEFGSAVEAVRCGLDIQRGLKEAIKHDPNLAKAYAQAANELVFTGKPQEALPLVEQAVQLSPQDPSTGVFFWVKGRAYFTLGNYPKAIESLEESIRLRPNLWFTHAWLVAAYALSDRDAEAGNALTTFETARFNSQFDLDRITQYYKGEQYQNPTPQRATAELLKGLRKAGLK